jgi:glycosyltransferase involved in cell wall biosynthesis
MPTIVLTLALPEATGAPKMAYWFARALRAAGHNVILIHGPEPPGNDKNGEQSILGQMRALGVQTETVDGLAFPLGSAVPRRVAEITRTHGAGCVIGFQQRDRVVALQAARRVGVAGIISAQNQHRFRGNWPVRKLKQWFYTRAVSRLADLIICPAQIVQNELVNKFGVPVERTAVLPNGVDVEGFPDFDADSKSDVRREFNVRDGELMLVSIGRIDTQKGYDVLLRALRQHPAQLTPVKLVVAGGISDGATEKRMRRYQAGLLKFVSENELEDRVIFAGWRNDCPLLLRTADFYVHPARWEGWPLAVVEAMSAELPTVMTDCSGRPEGYVDSEHGYVVPKDDADSLSRAMTRVIEASSDERNRMGNAARALALRHYDIKLIGERFVQLVEGVL